MSNNHLNFAKKLKDDEYYTRRFLVEIIFKKAVEALYLEEKWQLIHTILILAETTALRMYFFKKCQPFLKNYILTKANIM